MPFPEGPALPADRTARPAIMFLPTTKEEIQARGWDALDVILVSGDSYIDSSFIGVAVIGRVLVAAGFRVGIIAQPDTETLDDIGRLGHPRLFWGVTAGSVDSMVANYTALKKWRKSDDYTPGGANNRRPDRATIVYTNLIRRFMKTLPGIDTAGGRNPPVVLGGIEASLRRIAHYDFWTDRIRGSVLFDAKAEYILYGMADHSVVELARHLKDGTDPNGVRGLCYAAKTAPDASIRLPALDEVTESREAFIAMFQTFYRNNDAVSGKGLAQRHGDRYLIQNPPPLPLSQAELDAVFELGYERAQHPFYERRGRVRALDTIGFSVSTHRGCYGECNFCAIGVHEGRTVQSRSPSSILAEIRDITRHPRFKGTITDLGGPTANMYGYECTKKLTSGTCPKKRCLVPEICDQLPVNHEPHRRLLESARRIPGVRHVFVASGLRYDMILADAENGEAYLRDLATHHVSGQLKVAPEHSEPAVLGLMGKPGTDSLIEFKARFDAISRRAGKAQFLTYYMIAAHPGCTEADMRSLRRFCSEELHLMPEQVQIFTPTPSTYSSVMYRTEMDPFTGRPIPVERDTRRRERQKDIITEHRADRAHSRNERRRIDSARVGKGRDH